MWLHLAASLPEKISICHARIHQNVMRSRKSSTFTDVVIHASCMHDQRYYSFPHSIKALYHFHNPNNFFILHNTFKYNICSSHFLHNTMSQGIFFIQELWKPFIVVNPCCLVCIFLNLLTPKSPQSHRLNVGSPWTGVLSPSPPLLLDTCDPPVIRRHSVGDKVTIL